MIYIAISIVIAAIAAYESVKVLFMFVLVFSWLIYKRKHSLFILGAMFIGFFSYFYFNATIPKASNTVNITKITWTDDYRINGRFVRGFALGNDRNKWYVQLKIQSEQDKEILMNTSLSGKTFRVDAQEVTKHPLSHAYAFNMDDYIKSNGAVGQVEVENYQYVREKRGFVSFMARKRFELKRHIQSTFPVSLQAEAEALLIGSREQMPTDLQNAYQTLGITHLFAISGLHVGLVTLLLHEILIRIGIRRETANWLLIIALPLYAFLAGGAPSVWRSVSVTEIVLVSMLMRRKIAIADAFSLSVIGFVCLSPWVVYQIGFLLSYLAAFSLIYSTILLKSSTSYLRQSFVITAVCQLMVYPILVYQFYEVSISSFLANLVFVPLFSFIVLPTNIFFLLLTYTSTSISKLLFSIYEPLRNILGEIITYLGSLPFQLWNPMKPSLSFIFLAYLGVILFFISMERRKNKPFSFILLILPMVMMHVTPYLDASTRITFLNVGQGDCIIIEMPYRKEVIMIDTGGLLRFEQEKWKETKELYEIGRQIVVPFLKGKGITKIDTLVITHADADHMEGAEEILEEIRVKEVHISPNSHKKEVMKDLMEEVERQQIPLYEKKEGDQIASKYFHLQYINPMDLEYEGNNDSLVLSMRNNHFQGLFTGDLEKEGEEEIVRKYSKELQQITLLKIGHHGSKTSSIQSFLELTRPKISIISAGYNNRYGHPHPEVVERLNNLKLPFLQTGTDGTIEVEITKKGEILVTTP
ncbi:DNA internalization-related competence protein ComEC/Rec2 [Psychrobacillus sp. L4]|uniref:DNA internalization-related competence protein ComEC/Rec2 n=1 Tax=Psychrobacillus sp. L4 TaxID=3236892 RepID=UPI0036F28794